MNGISKLTGQFLENDQWTHQSQRENIFGQQIGDEGPSSTRELHKKLPRN